ncbi:MAG: hypothetical protein PVH68_04770 [Armatimonadota bacterium]
MAHFVYFLPERTSITAEDLETLGIDDRFADLQQVQQTCTMRGPGDRRGALFRGHVDAGAGPALAYEADAQTWRDAPDGEYAVGYWTDDPPGPDDLFRAEPVDGHRVRLADGHQWLVPVARAFPGGTRLPERLMLGPDGGIVRRMLPEYVGLGRRAEKVWQVVSAQAQESDADVTLDVEEGWSIAAEALAINYRLGAPEVSMLGLLTTTNLAPVLQALVDWPTVEALSAAYVATSKKNGAEAPDSSPTGAGDEES